MCIYGTVKPFLTTAVERPHCVFLSSNLPKIRTPLYKFPSLMVASIEGFHCIIQRYDFHHKGLNSSYSSWVCSESGFNVSFFSYDAYLCICHHMELSASNMWLFFAAHTKAKPDSYLRKYVCTPSLQTKIQMHTYVHDTCIHMKYAILGFNKQVLMFKELYVRS